MAHPLGQQTKNGSTSRKGPQVGLPPHLSLYVLNISTIQIVHYEAEIIITIYVIAVMYIDIAYGIFTN